MELLMLFIGFVFGILGSHITHSLELQSKKKADADFAKKAIDMTIKEIERGLDRVKRIVELLTNNGVSYSHICTLVWQSSSERVTLSVEGTDVLELIHELYHYFDLINFHCDVRDYETGAGFARDNKDAIEKELAKLKELHEADNRGETDILTY